MTWKTLLNDPDVRRWIGIIVTPVLLIYFGGQFSISLGIAALVLCILGFRYWVAEAENKGGNNSSSPAQLGLSPPTQTQPEPNNGRRHSREQANTQQRGQQRAVENSTGEFESQAATGAQNHPLNAGVLDSTLKSAFEQYNAPEITPQDNSVLVFGERPEMEAAKLNEYAGTGSTVSTVDVTELSTSLSQQVPGLVQSDRSNVIIVRGVEQTVSGDGSANDKYVQLEQAIAAWADIAMFVGVFNGHEVPPPIVGLFGKHTAVED